MSLNIKDLSNKELAILVNDIRAEIEARQGKWNRYIEYLRQWADNHGDMICANQSPACYDEWCNMENSKNEQMA